MEITHETYRTISHDIGYSVDALKRHKANHLIVDLGNVKQAMEAAREQALAEVKQKETKEIEAEVKGSMASRLENAVCFLDQLREVRSKAASLLDQAEKAQDLRAAGTFLKELREQIRLMAELEGRLATQPQITIVNNPQWVSLRTLIVKALEPYPQAREAVARAIGA
jgi:lysyl-tRNA synthetase class I